MSKGALDVLYAVGVINDVEADKALVPGLERAIPKNKGVEFVMEPKRESWGTAAAFKDPDGNTFVLSSK